VNIQGSWNDIFPANSQFNNKLMGQSNFDLESGFWITVINIIILKTGIFGGLEDENFR
jgi:hypothetical protein